MDLINAIKIIYSSSFSKTGFDDNADVVKIYLFT